VCVLCVPPIKRYLERSCKPLHGHAIDDDGHHFAAGEAAAKPTHDGELAVSVRGGGAIAAN